MSMMWNGREGGLDELPDEDAPGGGGRGLTGGKAGATFGGGSGAWYLVKSPWMALRSRYAGTASCGRSGSQHSLPSPVSCDASTYSATPAFSPEFTMVSTSCLSL